MFGLIYPYLSGPPLRTLPPSGWGGVSRRIRARRRFQKPRHGWRIIAIALLLLLPTGCLTVASSAVGAGASAVGAYWDYRGAEKGKTVIVIPPIEDYSKELQAAAAAEMKAIPGPCPQDTVNVSDCSALKRLVIDYGDLRQRMRAAREKD